MLSLKTSHCVFYNIVQLFHFFESLIMYLKTFVELLLWNNMQGFHSAHLSDAVIKFEMSAF